MPGQVCAVVGCNSNSDRFRDRAVRFFRFPKRYPAKRRLWVDAMNRMKQDGTPWEPTDSSRVCSLHFVSGQPSLEESNPDWTPNLYLSGIDANTRANLTEADIVVKEEFFQEVQEEELLSTVDLLGIKTEGADLASDPLAGADLKIEMNNAEEEEEMSCDYEVLANTATQEEPTVHWVLEEPPMKKRKKFSKSKKPNLFSELKMWPLKLSSDIPGVRQRGGRYRCPVKECTTYTYTTKLLLDHLMNHHPDTPEEVTNSVLKAAKQDLEGPTKKGLDKAGVILNEVTSNTSSCPVKGCPGKAFSPVGLVDHVNRVHAQVRPFGCPDCPKVPFTSSAILLTQHYIAAHTRMVSPEDVLKRAGGAYKEYAERVIKTAEQQEEEVEIVQDQISTQLEKNERGWWICPHTDCPESFDQYGLIALLDHYSTEHGNAKQTPFLCPNSNCTYKNISITEVFQHVLKMHRSQASSYEEIVEKSVENIKSVRSKKIYDAVMSEKLPDKIQNDWVENIGLKVLEEFYKVGEEPKMSHAELCAYVREGPIHESDIEGVYYTHSNSDGIKTSQYICPAPDCKNHKSLSAEALLKHYLEKHASDLQPFTCPQHCPVSFNWMQGLKVHMAGLKHKISLDKRELLEQAEAVINACEDDIVKAIYQGATRMVYKGPEDDLVYKATQTLYASSLQLVKGMVKYICPYDSCGESLSHAAGMIGHVNRYHAHVSPFRCGVCEMLHASPENMASHLMNHGIKRASLEVAMAHPKYAAVANHLDQMMQTNEVKAAKLPVKKIAKIRMKEAKKVKTATKKKSPGPQVKKLPKWYQSWPEEDSNITGIKHRGSFYHCNQCDSYEPEVLDLLGHLLQHTNMGMPFKCPHDNCSRSFYHPKYSMQHLLIHHDQIVPMLEILDRVSTTIQSLNSPYLTAVFESARSDQRGPSQLKLEQAQALLHTVAPEGSGSNYSCPVATCPDREKALNTFSLQQLADHINRYHLLFKPFKCETCHLYGSSSSAMAAHRLQVHAQQVKPLVILQSVQIYKEFYERHSMDNKVEVTG